MDQPGNYLNNLSIGMEVEVNPQNDRTRKENVKGTITRILTNSPQHSHGILVEVENGVKGRVKNIINVANNATRSQDEPSKTVAKQDLISLIAKGENHFVEFKTSALWSLNFSTQKINESTSYDIKKYRRDASKFIIAKSLAGFLNSEGGNLMIGIKENKSQEKDEIVGVDSEFFKLKDPCTDGYRRMIVDEIIKKFFSSEILHHINNYIQIDFETIEEKTVCHIHLNKSDIKTFVNHQNKGYFFVRIDASTREIHGEEIVDYCLKRFSLS